MFGQGSPAAAAKREPPGCKIQSVPGACRGAGVRLALSRDWALSPTPRLALSRRPIVSRRQLYGVGLGAAPERTERSMVSKGNANVHLGSDRSAMRQPSACPCDEVAQHGEPGPSPWATWQDRWGLGSLHAGCASCPYALGIMWGHRPSRSNRDARRGAPPAGFGTCRNNFHRKPT